MIRFKNLLFPVLSLALIVAATPANAATKCENLAGRAVISKFGSYFYSNGKRFRSLMFASCQPTRSKAGKPYYNCQVAADGENAGTVTWQVMVNDSCNSVFAAFIIGEE